MLHIGNDRPAVLRPASTAFARPRIRNFGAKRWIAGLPLLAVFAFTFDGTAPAEVSLPEQAIAQEQEGRWSIGNVKSLIDAIEDSAKEGLNPADYQLAALKSAVEAKRKGPELDALAQAAALSLAHDYADGRIDDKQAFDWHIGPTADANALSAGLDGALDAGRVQPWLRSLLPDNDQYKALRAAYADTGIDPESRDLIRANMERWRWMPRDLGDHYIYVNVPTYRLEVMQNGVETASYNVVVGAPKTPTPQLLLHAQSVVANPSWTLPPSVLKEGRWQNKGYQVSKRADGSLMVRQPPGPTNALGRIKIDMPNPQAIYLHDTPHKAAFGKTQRALSHGCIRVENIQDLAASLSQDSARLDDALTDPRKTKVVQLERSVPVYLVYFTAQADADGRIQIVGDPYRRDAGLIAQLGGSNASVRMAAR